MEKFTTFDICENTLGLPYILFQSVFIVTVILGSTTKDKH